MMAVRRRVRRLRAGVAFIGLAALSAGLLALPPAASAATYKYPWFDPTESPTVRADQLLAALTFDQKVDFALWLQYPYPPPDSARPAFATEYGIPDPRPHDSPNGVFYTSGVTQFPSEATLASSFDTQLADQYGRTVADELRGKGYDGWLGPGLDLARNLKDGRLQGNAGEDPYLTGEITAAEVRGVQSQHITTVLKHYAGNLQETGRFGSPAIKTGEGNPSYNDIIGKRALQELYYEPFRRAVQEGGSTTIMCSYQKINGTNMCEDAANLAVPRTQWGFQGNIVPDFVGAMRSALTAVNAGVDVTGDPPPGVPAFLTRDDFTSGRVSAARLDSLLHRTLYSYFASGLFDDPVNQPPQDNVSTPQSVALAKQIGEQGTVLLKNQSGILPLGGGTKHLAVIGRARDDAVTIEGGSDFVLPNGPTTTALQAITSRAGQVGADVAFSQGSVGDSPLPAVPASVLRPSSGSGQGLLATYYPNFDWTGTPIASRVETSFQFASAPTDGYTGGPISGLGDQWSVRYTGTLIPPSSGRYVFSLNPAGTAKLFIGGKQIASGNTEATIFLGGQPYVYTGSVDLTAGKPVSIEVDYSVNESLFGPAFNFGWQPPTESKIAAAVAAASKADAAVVFVGAGSGEGMDLSTLSLGGDQDALIEAVARANPNTIVVLSTPGPVLMPWLNRVRAVIQAGYQGQQFGPAIASVLYGDVNPSGHLVMTYPSDDQQGQATKPSEFPGTVKVVKTVASPNGAWEYQSVFDEGIYIGYRYYDKYHQQPLFPFGYGLSYTTFRTGSYRVGNYQVGSTQPARVTLTVRNTGNRAGADVVQVYVGHLPTTVDTPAKQLAGFARVDLGPGESRQVDVQVDGHSLSYFDESANTWRTPTGRVPVYVGSSAGDVQLAGYISVS